MVGRFTLKVQKEIYQIKAYINSLKVSNQFISQFFGRYFILTIKDLYDLQYPQLLFNLKQIILT